jgi:hypothetical protein
MNTRFAPPRGNINRPLGGVRTTAQDKRPPQEPPKLIRRYSCMTALTKWEAKPNQSLAYAHKELANWIERRWSVEARRIR